MRDEHKMAIATSTRSEQGLAEQQQGDTRSGQNQRQPLKPEKETRQVFALDRYHSCAYHCCLPLAESTHSFSYAWMQSYRERRRYYWAGRQTNHRVLNELRISENFLVISL